MFINDLPQNIESVCLLYADVKTFRKITSPADGQALQRDLSQLSAWSVSWGLALNPSKCKSFTMTLRRAPVQTKYFIAGTELAHVDAVRDLGVTRLQAHIRTSCIRHHQEGQPGARSPHSFLSGRYQQSEIHPWRSASGVLRQRTPPPVSCYGTH